MQYTTSKQDRAFAKLLKEHFDFLQDSGWVLDWIANTFEPDGVFEVSVLDDWALDHGYVKEE